MILDGKAVAAEIIEELKSKLANSDKKPYLAVVLVGNNPASQVYVSNKKKKAEYIGVRAEVFHFEEDISEQDLILKVRELNNNPEITAILVQLPLPAHINPLNIVCEISPSKDVDGFTPENVGKLAIGLEPYYYPATPQGVMMLLDRYKISIAGKHAVVIGRSNIVGKPMAQMLLKRDATVTMCHSRTENLEDIIKTADIVVSAVGKKIVRCKMVNKKSVIVDVGIHRDIDGKLTGDVDFNAVEPTVEYITPVPGGVGPMTIASLMYNVVK